MVTGPQELGSNWRCGSATSSGSLPAAAASVSKVIHKCSAVIKLPSDSGPHAFGLLLLLLHCRNYYMFIANLKDSKWLKQERMKTGQEKEEKDMLVFPLTFLCKSLFCYRQLLLRF